MLKRFSTPLLALCLLAFFGCDAADPLGTAGAEEAGLAGNSGSAISAGQGQSYVLIAKGDLPDDLADEVAAAGGTLTEALPEIGVAFATSPAADFQAAAARIKGMETVQPDVVLDWVTPPDLTEVITDGEADAEAGDESLAADEPLAFYQWALDPVGAPAAWNAGYTGEGVRVAILDGGLYDEHPDLQENVDVSASASFVPGFAFNEDTGTFWHGTHVAGIVGAGDNGLGTIGIAPNATLVGVKVLHDGSGAFSWVINGIVYAATPRAEGGGGADVINMSLGATLNEKDKAIKKAVKELSKAIDRATKYAYKQGVVVVASAGNGATNFDKEGKELLKVPAENKHVLSISATGPIGWGRGATNFTTPSYFTDHGKSLVDLGAPGGNQALAFVEGDFSPCTVGGLTATCALFDGYLSTSRGSTPGGAWSWAQGTSMASPVVAGVAALVVEQIGPGNAAQVISRLRSTADDLGKPGQDKFYGHGFINAAHAVSAQRARAPKMAKK